MTSACRSGLSSVLLHPGEVNFVIFPIVLLGGLARMSGVEVVDVGVLVWSSFVMPIVIASCAHSVNTILEA
jgi:hypothetical protein